jgi:hypothetical protein
MHKQIFFNGYFQGHCDPLMVPKLVHSQALKPDSLQTLMHHLISFTIQQQNVLLLRITGLQPICKRKLNIHFEVLIDEMKVATPYTFNFIASPTPPQFHSNATPTLMSNAAPFLSLDAT